MSQHLSWHWLHLLPQAGGEGVEGPVLVQPCLCCFPELLPHEIIFKLSPRFVSAKALVSSEESQHMWAVVWMMKGPHRCAKEGTGTLSSTAPPRCACQDPSEVSGTVRGCHTRGDGTHKQQAPVTGGRSSCLWAIACETGRQGPSIQPQPRPSPAVPQTQSSSTSHSLELPGVLKSHC